MIHALLLVVAFFLVLMGILFCVLLVHYTLKAGKGIWLITIPGVLIVAAITIDFICHVLHLPPTVFPHQRQIVNAIHWTLRAAAIPLLLTKLYENWSKKRKAAPKT